jgi:transcriptional regulator with XRE-family HTH domain
MKNKFGEEIRQIRKNQGKTLAQVANALGIDRSHLTKVELGQDRPSEKLFMSLIAHFSVERVTALRLWSLAGFTGEFVTGESNIGGKEKGAMDSPMIQPQPQTANVNMDPANKPTLYTDSIFVNANDFGVVVDFGRRVGPEQHFIVTSVGMSYDHAKKLIEILNDQIEKNER